MDSSRYLWYSDTHLANSSLFARHRFISRINRLNPDGLFLTGDISSGRCIERDLTLLAENIKCPIYFNLGNHDYHWRSIGSVHQAVTSLCAIYPNLRWMTNEGIIQLNEDVALIGVDGWFDAKFGDPYYLRFTTDWLLTTDFWFMNWTERIALWRRMAKASADRIKYLLEKIPEETREVFILTHFPPWPEADRARGTKMEKFWLPYNTNHILGQAIEEVAESWGRKRRITVLAGHTHSECTIRVRKNVDCRVAPAKYSGSPKVSDLFVI